VPTSPRHRAPLILRNVYVSTGNMGAHA
jgi:hypothetical protein